jgi:hypothetical protein
VGHLRRDLLRHAGWLMSNNKPLLRIVGGTRQDDSTPTDLDINVDNILFVEYVRDKAGKIIRATLTFSPVAQLNFHGEGPATTIFNALNFFKKELS